MDDSIITSHTSHSSFPSEPLPPTGISAPERPTGRAPELQITNPLRSAETFEAYCQHIQSRLAEHAVRRRHFLQNAYDRLTQLLQQRSLTIQLCRVSVEAANLHEKDLPLHVDAGSRVRTCLNKPRNLQKLPAEGCVWKYGR